MKLDEQARTRLLSLALYQTGWFACVIGAAHGQGTAGAAAAVLLVSVHVWLARDRSTEVRLILAAGLLGLVVETFQQAWGVLVFPDHPPGAILPPIWMIALWLQFATLFNYGLSWLSGRKLLAGALGLLGGPLAFLGGERLGAAAIGDPRWRSLMILGAVWAIAVPTLVALAESRPTEARYVMPWGLSRDPARARRPRR